MRISCDNESDTHTSFLRMEFYIYVKNKYITKRNKKHHIVCGEFSTRICTMGGARFLHVSSEQFPKKTVILFCLQIFKVDMKFYRM